MAFTFTLLSHTAVKTLGISVVAVGEGGDEKRREGEREIGEWEGKEGERGEGEGERGEREGKEGERGEGEGERGEREGKEKGERGVQGWC